MRRVAILAAALIVVASTPAALLGLRQIGETLLGQIHGPAHVTDFVAMYSGANLLSITPALLYAPGAVAELDARLTAGAAFDRPFSFLPHAALLLAPIGRLEYALAYALWFAVNLAALGGAVWLLAPRPLRCWLVLVAALPVHLSLIMGQTTPLALLAFSALVRLAERRPWLAGLLVGASSLTWKPQLLLPALVVSLTAGRCWSVLVSGVAAVIALLSCATLALGPGWPAAYAAQGAQLWQLLEVGSTVEYPGQTLLGFSQAVLGPGSVATAVAIVGAALAYLWLAHVWWRGLRHDGRAALQFAAVPVVGILAAPHALAYELVLWLGSVWLLLQYASQSPGARPLVVALSLLVWAACNAAVLTGNSPGYPLAVPAGLALLGGIAWLERTHSSATQSSTRAAATRSDVAPASGQSAVLLDAQT